MKKNFCIKIFIIVFILVISCSCLVSCSNDNIYRGEYTLLSISGSEQLTYGKFKYFYIDIGESNRYRVEYMLVDNANIIIDIGNVDDPTDDEYLANSQMIVGKYKVNKANELTLTSMPTFPVSIVDTQSFRITLAVKIGNDTLTAIFLKE